jgi:hypothetical protein
MSRRKEKIQIHDELTDAYRLRVFTYTRGDRTYTVLLREGPESDHGTHTIAARQEHAPAGGWAESRGAFYPDAFEYHSTAIQSALRGQQPASTINISPAFMHFLRHLAGSPLLVDIL